MIFGLNFLVGAKLTGGGAATLNDGLLAYYKLDGNANDSLGLSGGTEYDMSYTTGKINQAGSFNGSTSYIAMADSALLRPSTFTVSAWVYFNTFGSYTEIFESYSQEAGPAGFEFRMNGNALQLVVGNLGAYDYYNTGPFATTGVWYHLLATFDNITRDSFLYVNSVLTSGKNLAYTIGYNTSFNRVRLGVNEFSAGSKLYYLNGLMDELGFWNRVLTPIEITELYNIGLGKTYPFV